MSGKETPVPETAFCAHCGAPWLTGAQFCYSCGKSPIPAWPAVPAAQPPAQAPANAPAAQPWPGVAAPLPVPPVAPPFGGSPFAAPPAVPPFATPPLAIPTKPFAILFLTVVEIVIAAVCAWVAIGFFWWVNYGVTYQDTGEVPLDLVFGIAYVATSTTMFGVARGLWSTQSWAWPRACLLNLALLGLIVVSMVPWGLTALDVVGIAANLTMLACLCATSTRRLFGLPPLAFLAGDQ